MPLVTSSIQMTTLLTTSLSKHTLTSHTMAKTMKPADFEIGDHVTKASISNGSNTCEYGPLKGKVVATRIITERKGGSRRRVYDVIWETRGNTPVTNIYGHRLQKLKKS